ncbi:MAG: hypothetical protein Q8P59_06200 [Dehalococcoidia bacterium]|nr:hypothetical protein [Dehalococcoidia bacterium]
MNDLAVTASALHPCFIQSRTTKEATGAPEGVDGPVVTGKSSGSDIASPCGAVCLPNPSDAPSSFGRGSIKTIQLVVRLLAETLSHQR